MRLRWVATAVALLAVAAIVAGIAMFSRNRVGSTLVAPEKSIAVLPFANLSSDKENASFADGLQDEILTRLSKIADLKVISHASKQHYKSAPENLPDHRRIERRQPLASRGTQVDGHDDAQRSELRSLLEQLVRKTYQRNLLKTLDYDVMYRGSRDAGGDTKVLTEAKNKLKPREPAVRVDYVVKQTSGGLKVVDISTEGSSLTKNYYDQFRKKMNNPGEGYSNIVVKLKEKIAKKD